MSLKTFHLVFVTALTSLSVACAYWKFRDYSATHANGDLVFAIGATLAAVATLVYGKYFLKKLKKFSFL